MSIARRSLIQAAAAVAAAPAVAQPAPAAPPGKAPDGPPPPPVTRILARYAATAPVEQVPPAVRKEATRTLVNWVGCAVGGARQPAPSRAAAALAPF
jgi:hypothetical protein